MCGIIGYVGNRAAQPLLLDGLATLEYRGYDSAGIALERAGRAERVRSVGNLASLRAAVATAERVPALAGGGVALAEREPTTGIGHTRWATHGRVNEANAHPHDDASGRIQVVLNGIVENHAELREALEAGGQEFTSQTDAEAVSQLIGALYEGDLMAAVRAAYAQLHGHFAFVAMAADEPGLLVGARREAPLVIGAGDGEQFIASAISAFADSTDQLLLVEDGELVARRPFSAQRWFRELHTASHRSGGYAILPALRNTAGGHRPRWGFGYYRVSASWFVIFREPRRGAVCCPGADKLWSRHNRHAGGRRPRWRFGFRADWHEHLDREHRQLCIREAVFAGAIG